MVNVLFLHPDLGIGGAERLVVDAAVALKNRGHSVHVLTAHHDLNHCFPETKPDGNVPVTCAGDWLPRSFFGRCQALCAYLRMVYLAFYAMFTKRIAYDVVVVDLVSACIPVLKAAGAPVLFYCHFPDQLLTQRKSLLKGLYRRPLDWFEELTTGMADKVVVNSKFTAGVFKETFKNLKIEPDVLYPSLNFAVFDQPLKHDNKLCLPSNVRALFVSLNRYERKKNVGLAIKAMGHLREQLQEKFWNEVHLIVAGGYDDRVIENIEYHRELEILAEALQIDENHITFLRSISDEEKRFLLHSCRALIYTPTNEHFGIVPIEAMALGRPVIAVNSGGPKETLDDGETGFLCNETAEGFADAMKKLIKDRDLAREMGEVGQKRVRERFSFQAFAEQFENCVMSLVDKKTH